MSSNKRVIIFSLVLAVIFLIPTYIFCHTNDYEWLNISDSTNSFLVTIFGGAFASTVVVLLCELQKYYMNKRDTENALYYHMTILYTHSLIIKNIVKKIIQNPEVEVFSNMLKESIRQISIALYNVKHIDYNELLQKVQCKFIKCNIGSALQEFRKSALTIENSINECIYLDIAINEAKICEYEKGVQNVKITGKYKDVNSVAKIISLHFDDIISKCENLLSDIDYRGRFSWNEQRKIIQANSDIYSKNCSLNNFIEKNKNVL
jgi:hypothetical protein